MENLIHLFIYMHLKIISKLKETLNRSMLGPMCFSMSLSTYSTLYHPSFSNSTSFWGYMIWGFWRTRGSKWKSRLVQNDHVFCQMFCHCLERVQVNVENYWFCPRPLPIGLDFSVNQCTKLWQINKFVMVGKKRNNKTLIYLCTLFSALVFFNEKEFENLG